MNSIANSYDYVSERHHELLALAEHQQLVRTLTAKAERARVTRRPIALRLSNLQITISFGDPGGDGYEPC